MDTPPETLIAELSYPTRVVFGAGAIQRTPAHVKRLQIKRPLVVTDAGVVKAGLAGKLYDVLKKAGIPYAAFEQVQPNPTEKDVFDGLAAYRKERCDGVIGIGGGSPLDTAKLVALSVNHAPPLSKYDDATGGDAHVTGEVPPIIAIPTTAGTGS